MKKRVLMFTFIISALLMSCFAKESSSINNNELVMISVEESSEYIIKSENPIEIPRGETANFEITFHDNYDYVSSSNGTYDSVTGFLTIDNVQYSQTIYIDCVEMVIVTLATPEDCHFIVTSENPVRIKKGANASFDINFEEGYVFESSTDGVFRNGKFIISNVQNSFTARLYAKMKDLIRVRIFANPLLGEIKINGSLNNEYIGYIEDLISLEAIPLNGKRFTCWSIDGYTSESMPFSFERLFDLKLLEDINLYANFWDNNDNTIIYSGNGGATLCGDELIYYQHTKPNRIRVNTIQGSKAFYRDGYLLDSWNTKEDGSGLRIGLGSRFKISDKNNPPTLYATWVKETSCDFFDFEINNDYTYTLTNCTSTDSVIVIPENFNNFPITKIRSNAFKSLPFKILYFPQFLKEVESNAIINCSKFDELHFFDYLDIIPNDFYDTKKPSYLFINANTDPCYIGLYQNLFVRKVDFLTECNDEKIVLIGNSNVYYSVDGSLIHTHFQKDVLCFGVQDFIGVAWELACLRHYCQADKNIIVFCAEFNNLLLEDFTEHKYYAAEGNYDLLLAINFNELDYKNVFDAYTTFKEFKKMSVITPYSKSDYLCDTYGCSKLNVEPFRDDEWVAFIEDVDLDFYRNGGFNWIEDYCSSFIDSKFYISSCVFNRNCIAEHKREEFYSTYQQSIIDYTPYPVISKLVDYAFPGHAMFNDNYHLVYSYAIERTNRLITDLSSFID